MKTLLLAMLVALPVCAAHEQTVAAPVSHEPVTVFPSGDLHREIARLIPAARESGSSGSTLADYGSYRVQLSVRTKSGGAEVHAHWDDVMMVEQGHATLITGGTVVRGQSKPDGETLGTSIEGGRSHALSPGDVFTVRAGTPHQTIVAPGSTYAAVVIKIHEP